MSSNDPGDTSPRRFPGTLFESAPLPMVATDASLRVAAWNPAAEALFGWTCEEAWGRPLPVVPQDGRAGLEGMLAALQGGAPVVDAERVAVAKDGRRIPVAVSAAWWSHPDQGSGTVWIYRSLAEGREAGDDAPRAARHIVDADRLSALSTVVGGVAHEIGSPLGLITLNVPLLEEAWKAAIPILDAYRDEHGEFLLGALPYAELRDFIPTMLANQLAGAEHIRRIVADLRAFARPPADAVSELVSLNAVVQSAAALLGDLIRRSTDMFHVDYGRDLPWFPARYQHLEQVVINLLLNACQALEGRRGAVSVATAYDPERGEVSVTVGDQGPGIPPDILPKVMDPFFTTRRASGGVGLGLAVSDTIAREHGGRIELESKEGSGTRVTLRLPVRGPESCP